MELPHSPRTDQLHRRIKGLGDECIKSGRGRSLYWIGIECLGECIGGSGEREGSHRLEIQESQVGQRDEDELEKKEEIMSWHLQVHISQAAVKMKALSWRGGGE